MAAFDTVAKLVAEARVLLQDRVVEYRYSDDELLSGLNLALLEARRLRPDMFLDDPTDVPSYDTVDTTAVEIDQQYRSALVYYMVGHAHLRDEEDAQDARATTFLNKFTSQMLVAQS